MRSYWRSIGLGLLLAGTISALPVSTAAAQEAEQAEFCAVLLEPTSAPGTPSEVRASACSDVSREEAHSKLYPGGTQARAAGDVLIMSWYEGADYSDDSNDVYGTAPCDSAGYEMHPDTSAFFSWGRVMSSARGYNSCNVADFTTIDNTHKETFLLPVGNLGNTLNDNVGKIHVWNG